MNSSQRQQKHTQHFFYFHSSKFTLFFFIAACSSSSSSTAATKERKKKAAHRMGTMMLAPHTHAHLFSAASASLRRILLRPLSSPLLLRPPPFVPQFSSRSLSSFLVAPVSRSPFPSGLLRFDLRTASHLQLQVRCSGSLKAKSKPRGPLWRQRKGVSKEALQVVFELKRCKGDKQKERSVLQTSASRLLKMDLLMVLEELRRQEECSLAKQVFTMVRKEEWYKPDIFLYREMIDTLGKNKLIEDVEQLVQEMQEEGIALNAMILTELMGAYIRNDNIARAYEIFEQIRQGEYEPEYITYEILCRALKKEGDFEKLKIVMEYCGEAFPDSPPPFSRMVIERGL